MLRTKTFMCAVDRILQAGEEVLNRAIDPANVLRVSFRERKKKNQQQTQEKLNQLKQQEKQNEKHQQQQQQQQQQEATSNGKGITCSVTLVNYPLGGDQAAPSSKSPETANSQPEQPVKPVEASGPADDAGKQVESVTKPVDQPKILGITEPLPEPVMSLMIVSDSVYDDEQQEEDEEQVRTKCC